MDLRPIQPGQVITAEFLNKLVAKASPIPSFRLGQYSDTTGSQTNQQQFTDFTKFIVRNDLGEVLPPWSVFTLEPDPTLTDQVQIPTVNIMKYKESKNPLFSNGGTAYNWKNTFQALPIRARDKVLLDTDGTVVPGDYCGPKVDDFVVTKSGTGLLCLEPGPGLGLYWFCRIPAGVGSQQLGFITAADIPPRSLGQVELCDKDDILNGTIVTVYNNFDITFYIANVTPGEEAPADRVMLFRVDGYPEPLIFPWMLSPCAQIDPSFQPEYQ